MYNSKTEGGMGFRNLHAFNIAMLAKQCWQLITNPQSLLTQVFKAKYYPAGSFMTATLDRNPSYAWRSLLFRSIIA